MSYDIDQSSVFWQPSFWLTYFLFQALVCVQGIFARVEGFWSGRQMLRENRMPTGLPFTGHGGIHGDFYIVSLLCSYLMTRYGERWIFAPFGMNHPLIWSFSSALTVTILAHALWARDSRKIGCSGVHADRGSLTMAGWVHSVYMTLALTILLCYYFFLKSYNIPVWEVRIVSALLMLHVVLGMWHPVPKLLQPSWWGGKWHTGSAETLILLSIILYRTGSIVAKRTSW